MYIDYVLFIVGGILLAVTIILTIILLRSANRSKEYRRMLSEETERVDMFTTWQQTQRLTEAKTASKHTAQTELLIEENRYLLATEKIANSDSTEAMQFTDEMNELTAEDNVGAGLDLNLLSGKYQLLREIHGGGMSRIFLARHVKLGNEWIVKYIDGANAELANEAEVLKKLNHISLPQIIDIFQSTQGFFLVERYIEGYSLAQALKLEQTLTEGQIIDWGIQLAQVLRYLHTLDTAIIHCDLKPSNIMVTHDDRLVLIDFGISKRSGSGNDALGITYNYAAPEQFQGRAANAQMIRRRFGNLPPEQPSWRIDERTDIYSAGAILFELLVGETPNLDNWETLKSHASVPMVEVIQKCLAINPADRYQSAEELVKALETLNNRRLSMMRALVRRKTAIACCILSLFAGLGTTACGIYVNQMENLSLITMDPGEAVLTAQSSVQVLIEKTLPNGKTSFLEPKQVQWSYDVDNIARLDSDRLVGLNVGETTLYGKYRNHVFALAVTVTEPIENLVDVALRYSQGVKTSLYAGNGERELLDGDLTNCSFISPESMSVDDQTLYIADSGVLRQIEAGSVSSLFLEPSFLTVDKARGYGDDIYLLTGPWKDEEGSYYGFLRITHSGAEFLYYTEAAWSVISDFVFDADGTLWFIQENLGNGMTRLHTLNTDTLETAWVMELPDGAHSMAFDEDDMLYISVPDEGVILRVAKDESSWQYFAGIAGEHNFIDGTIPNFYRPTSLAATNDALYVLDFDTVRKITIEGAGALFTETLAGMPTADTNPKVVLGKGGESILPASESASLAIDDEGHLLLSDPKNSVIYVVEMENDEAKTQEE